MKEQVFVSVVIYAHNNESTVREILMTIDDQFDQNFKSYEIILVNDFSQDRTLENAREAIKKVNGDVTIINLSRKHGIEHAMMAGLNKSMGDFVFEVENASLDYPVELLYELFQTATKRGYDIVAATSGSTSWKSKLFYKILNNLSYMKLSLQTESIRLVTRRALNSMLNLKEKVRYRKALYELTGYSKYLITYHSTSKPQKKKLNGENISLAIDALVSFSSAGLRAAHYLTFAFFGISILMGIYALYNYFFNQSVVEGWTTLMILISFGFAGLFFIFGVIGEYISRILTEIQNRPFYSTSSVEMFKEKRSHLQLVEKSKDQVTHIADRKSDNVSV
ncbi:glycosyltransferase [Gorillibacterium timonense]|uniref:glycosyltransferase n=1 Tax=Gorillibacterium timonense TaxID=1689269 RepID=UPI00071CAA3B|nr:glycosyltransferase [Gorillibacterium timonense]